MNRECRRVRARLVELADGNPAESVSAELRRHLDTCPDCARELETLREETGLLRGLAEPEPPDGLEAGIMRRVRAAGRAEPRPLARLVLVRAGAVALFALGLLLGVGVGLGLTGDLPPHYPAGRPGAGSPSRAFAAEFTDFSEEIPW